MRIDINKPNKWDSTSTKILIVIILILITLLLSLNYIPKIVRNNKIKKLKGETSGSVISIESIKTRYQHFNGSHTSFLFYTVKFAYKVNGKSYININNLPNKGIDQKFIDDIWKSNYKKTIKIRYKLTNPEESLIFIE
jgi:competence protein ComGC